MVPSSPTTGTHCFLFVVNPGKDFSRSISLPFGEGFRRQCWKTLWCPHWSQFLHVLLAQRPQRGSTQFTSKLALSIFISCKVAGTVGLWALGWTWVSGYWGSLIYRPLVCGLRPEGATCLDLYACSVWWFILEILGYKYLPAVPFPTFLGFGKVTNRIDLSTFFPIVKMSASASQMQQQ